ncbi:hypothetical protein PFBG_03422 [Plasmodium falciparum 7G8]|uniref:Uncharacterized protein n=1 Tax=Plasmodium falciparum (isolate 7G8) TaxID=57266 RepID=W7FAI2_PLAF8|nr:hypothetical protein PFBG_03422 [Plasmodium falciparum 7G8]
MNYGMEDILNLTNVIDNKVIQNEDKEYVDEIYVDETYVDNKFGNKINEYENFDDIPKQMISDINNEKHENHEKHENRENHENHENHLNDFVEKNVESSLNNMHDTFLDQHLKIQKCVSDKETLCSLNNQIIQDTKIQPEGRAHENFK